VKILDRLIKWIIVVLVFLLPFVIRIVEYNFRLLFAQTFVAILLIIFSFRVKFSNNISLNPIIILFVLFGIISYFYSPYRYIGEYSLISLFTVVGFYFVATNVLTRNEIPLIFFTLLASATLVSIYGILQFIGLDFLHWGQPGGRVISAIGNANLLAAYLSLIVPIGIGLVFLKHKLYNKLYIRRLILLCLGLVGFCLFLTFSRSGFLAVFIGVFIFGILYFSKFKDNIRIHNKKLVVISIVVTAIILSSITYYLLTNPDFIRHVLLRRTARPVIYKTILEIIKSRPITGYGLGSLPVIFMKFRPNEFLKYHYPDQEFLRHAHNEFLELWVERGIVSMLLFAVLLGIFLYRGIYWVRSSNFPNVMLGMASLGALSTVVILSLCTVSLSYISVNFHLWLLFSVVSINYKETEMVKNNNFKSKLKTNFIFVLIFIFAFILISCGTRSYLDKFPKRAKVPFFLVSPSTEERINDLETKIKIRDSVNSDDYYNLATSYAKKRNWDRAIKYYKETLRLDPENKFAYNNLGNIYFVLERFDDAVRNYTKAVKSDEDYLKARCNLGLVYFKRGQVDRVIEEMNYILERDPGNLYAKEIEYYIMNQ